MEVNEIAMSLKNTYIKNFLKRADKKDLAKWAVEAGYDTAKEMTKKELVLLWHKVLSHSKKSRLPWGK
jgi:hypothetical protein